MPRRKLSEEGRKRIAEAARARWARQRAAKAQGIMTVAAKPGRKPRAGRSSMNGRRRARRPARAGIAVSSFGGQVTEELITMRRRIDQELADRFVREYQAR